MLKSLSYSVTFPNGRKLQNNLSFHEGFGAITGPNEAGKSFIIEMIRYGLFGTAALRGEADDYKSLKHGMEFSLKGQNYKVTRTSSNAKLFRDGTEIAVGIKPVNQKIVSLLGFGLDVFDVACIANQGSLEKLGDMKPTERKRMVDSVIGLGMYDEIAKWAGEQASLHTKEAETIERMMREPVAPEIPLDYEPTSDIQPRVEIAREQQNVANQLKGWLSTEPAGPCKPTKPVETLSKADLEARIAAQKVEALRISELEQKLRAIPTQVVDPALLDQWAMQWDAYEQWLEKQTFLRKVPTPELIREEAMQGLEDHRLADMFDVQDRLHAKIKALEAKGEHECPACHHHWPVASTELDELDGELSIVGDETKGVVRPVRPAKSSAYFDQQLGMIERCEEHANEWLLVRDAVETEKPALSRIQIDQCREAIKLQEQSAGLRQELDQLRSNRDKADWTVQLNLILRYETLSEEYERQREIYERWLVEKGQKEERLKEVQPVADTYQLLFDQLNRAANYERDLVRYQLELDNFSSLQKQMVTANTKAMQWRKAKAALTRLRIMVKQQLVPSLNKVASHLLKGMTNGQRQTILVDEEFNIMVDDQKLDTLSGSGKAVVNLALRLGLGQVLTNNVFSLFVGDEIDASMDKDRAEATSDTLHSLTTFIKQILLVTHKTPDADYSIELEAQ
jgi:exonuclease SbcC